MRQYRIIAGFTTWGECKRSPFTYMCVAIGTVIVFLAVAPIIMDSHLSRFWKTEAICWMGTIMVTSMLIGIGLLVWPRSRRSYY